MEINSVLKYVWRCFIITPISLSDITFCEGYH
nr:MAG TPA: hypothetical protein [Caudoviricetes sp.]